MTMSKWPDRPGLELDPDKHERRKLAEVALRLLERQLERRDNEPIFVPTPGASIDLMLRPPPEDGAEITEVLGQLQAVAQLGWSKLQGGDLAFIPSSGLYTGVIAAMLASGLHAFTGSAHESPALVALEESVLRWLAGLMGLPHTAEGVLLSGGSLANQTAIACARDAGRYDASTGVAYVGERVHHSLYKAFRLCGVPASGVRTIPALPDARIDVAALRAQIERDRAAGLRPWLVVGVAGSTDTGSIDELPTLASIASDLGAWFHVDAAYGGMFRLTARGAERLLGLEAADSITVDAHKGLLLPYGVAALLVREPGALARTHAGSGAYMRDVPQAQSLPHYFERGPELTRPYRGLLVWLPLQLHGVARFREVLDRSLDLAAQAARQLRTIDGIEVIQDPSLSIAVFRAAEGDGATHAILDAINDSGQLRVSSTKLQRRTAIRLAFLHVRTGQAELDRLLGIVEHAMGVPARR
jgi:aromatic-L-amino-acid/L-tryptophan decarboxylase